MAPPICPGPRFSRRQMLQIGGAGYLGLTLPGFLRGAFRGSSSRAGDSGSVDRDLPERRAQPSRHVGHEAGGPGRDSRRVQADRHQSCRACSSASTCRGWPGRCTAARWSARCTTASTTPTRPRSTPGLTGHDRGEIGGGAKPTDYPAIGSVVGLMPAAAKAGSCPTCRMPYITKEGAGGPPQPGFFGGWLGRTHDPALRACATPTPRLRHAGAGSRRRHESRPARTAAPVSCRIRSARLRPEPVASGHGRLPGQGLRPADVAGHAARLSDRPGAGAGCATATAATSTARACCWPGG